MSSSGRQLGKRKDSGCEMNAAKYIISRYKIRDIRYKIFRMFTVSISYIPYLVSYILIKAAPPLVMKKKCGSPFWRTAVFYVPP